MIRPCRAAVVPRVVDPETQEYVPIDEKILEYYHAKIRTVRLVGHGKTTALEHLADALVDYPGIVLLDEHAFLNPLQYVDAKLIVFFSRCNFKADVRLTLAPWTRDDVIEFLLAKHPARCKPVMARLLAADDGWLTDGDPRLWAVVLGIMADDDEVDSVEDALRKKISTVLDGGSLSDFVVATCLKHVGKHQLFESDLEELKPLLETEVFKLLGCPGARLILDADQICEAIKNRRTLECFEQPWPERLYELVAKKFRWNSGEMVWLSQIASLHENKAAAVAASLMFKIDKSWKPESPGPFWYVGARLKNAGWSNVNLEGSDLSSAILIEANLRNAKLTDVTATTAVLIAADLTDADISGANFRRANLAKVVLLRTKATTAQFVQANLNGCNCGHAKLYRADFSGANLTGADFRNAHMRYAKLADATVAEADFTGADLQNALLRGLDLTHCSLDYVDLTKASVSYANLEDTRIQHAVFSSANCEYCFFTGSRFSNVNLSKCDLSFAKLAEVDWPGCNLAGADFSGALFHMGSTRCGLVGSPYPSHGTRTGFYTDEYDECFFRRPEEIRKANLCDCDLTGANVSNCDFYLVDLRGARYDALQRQHFKTCGAILS